MNKDMLGKTLTLSIIILFIGLGIQPALAVESKLSANNIQQLEDCDCQTVVSDDELNKLDKAINRIEGYTKLLSLYSKRNPELVDISGELASEIENIKELFEELKSKSPKENYPVICFILYLIHLRSGERYEHYSRLIYENLFKFISLIYIPFWFIYGVIWFYSYWAMGDLGCKYYP